MRRVVWNGRAPVALVTCIAFASSALLPARRALADDQVVERAVTARPSADEVGPPAVRRETSAAVKPAAAEEPAASVERRAGAGRVHFEQLATQPAPDAVPVGGDKSGASSQAISLPQGAGKIQGMGESFSTQLSTGVASFTVPFALVPARGGAQPSVSLAYSSGSGTGVAGMGWDVGVAFIARQTDRGLPHYQDPTTGGVWAPTQDRFVFNGGQELVPICLVTGGSCSAALKDEVMPAWGNGWQYFRPRVEGGFLRFFWSPDHRTWRVQSKSGTSMELGAPLDGDGYAGALETDPSGAHIFRWDLVREYDAYGGANPTGSAQPTPVNIVAYRYLTDGGMAYLSDVYDTPPVANPSSAPLSAYAHHARLSYETRTDPTLSFRRGWQTSERLRLARVDVTSQTFAGSGNRELVRRYHLSYDPTYHLSLLASVQMEGRCATTEGGPGAVAEDTTGQLPASTGCPTLPAMTFGYQHVAGYNVAGSSQTADLVGYEAFDERPIAMTQSPPNSIDEQKTDLFDINSDGLPDVVVTTPGTDVKFPLYLNGYGGVANAFGASRLGVMGVLGATSTDITLQNDNVAVCDLDGDGTIDWLHQPAVKSFAVYTPQPTNSQWFMVGRAIPTSALQDPHLDLGEDAPDIHVFDANGDGLVDVVRATGTEMQTFFSLGRYPGGDGNFGSATWTGPATAGLSLQFVPSCVPLVSPGLPIRFSDPQTHLADLNGDGLQDIVYVQQGNIQYWPGRGDGSWGTGPLGSCTDGFAANTYITMSNAPQYSDPSGSALHLDDVNGDGLDDLVQVRFDAIDVWLNVDGVDWTPHRHVIQGVQPAQGPQWADKVRLVDMNGSGTRDVLWGEGGSYRFIDLSGGQRPWALTHVANGLGKTTDLSYASSTQLMLAAAAAGTPWTSVTPEPVHVVTQVTDRDNLNLVGRAGGVYVTQYTYSNPVYDGRQREFRGFESATETKVGDANSPTSRATTTFLLGQCSNDENLAVDPCSEEGRWQDNPREALKGLPIVAEVSDAASSTYASTEHHTYRLRKLYSGLDGREVRDAFESQVDTFLYDDGPFVPALQPTELTDVELEVVIGSPLTDRTEKVSVQSTGGLAHLHRSVAVDLSGNTTVSTADGNLGVDEPITVVSNAAQISASSGWLFRTVETYVNPGHREATSIQYDQGGSPTVKSAALQGSLPLTRFYTDGAFPPTEVAPPSTGVAPPPPTASSDKGAVLVSSQTYDPLVGVLVQETGPNGRCRQLTYDTQYLALPIQDTTYVGVATNECTGTPLNTVRVWDRGLQLVVQTTDPNAEVGTAQYDAFGRVTSVSDPDPVNIGSPSGAASMLVKYVLPADPATTPYTIVRTQRQDGPTAAATHYHDSWSYVDGFGRTIVALQEAGEADPSAGNLSQWIVDGLASHDAKGSPQRAYLRWFWTGTADQFPLATTPLQYTSTRYDAFGRVLQSFSLDGSMASQAVYHSLSTETWDAADLAPGPHQGTPAARAMDGHGRTSAVTERVHAGSAIEEHTTKFTYLPTGEPIVVTRTNVATGEAVVRWSQYDSLGRMVLNVEPDTSSNFGPPGTNPSALQTWRYAYDDSGNLVGTSDARGCGANYAYDAGGRLLTEDFSPCLMSHQPYSPPSVGCDGTEACYLYDAIDPSVVGLAGFPTGSPYLGRLASVSARGSRTALAYDGRGRTVDTARQVAVPGVSADFLSRRYAGHWYQQPVVYDGADRVVSESTGVEASELLAGGQSAVTIGYSARGTISKVGSSYGPLVASVTYAADGLIGQIVYGDAAATTTSLTYDFRRRLSSVISYRGPPAMWSQPPAGYLPAPTPNGPPSTLQLLLENLSYQYDNVDNPIEIRDARNPSEWPEGAQPVTRQVEYDDLYRVTRVAYSYPTGTDGWVDPFQAEDQGIPEQQDRRRARPSPHASFAERPLTQSFAYDWLGNTTRTDDDTHGFYDRSLGAVANGTPTLGPYQLRSASGASGSLTSAYDAAGHLVGMAIARTGHCVPTGSECSQRFVYDWDEIGRLVHARRWDMTNPGLASDPTPTGPPGAELAYSYDADDRRTLKTARNAGPDGQDVHTAYVFDSLDLRRTTFDGNDYARGVQSEVAYLNAAGVHLANLHYALESEPALASGQLHVFVELRDHLGSTSLIVDRATSELVEAETYQPYGATESDYRPTRWASFREDYAFTGKESDVELGLTYFGKRYLSPALGRWVSPDPMAIHTGQADPNVYAYVHGTPLRAVDPIGLDGAPLGSPSNPIVTHQAPPGVAIQPGQMFTRLPGNGSGAVVKVFASGAQAAAAGGTTFYRFQPLTAAQYINGQLGSIPTLAPPSPSKWATPHNGDGANPEGEEGNVGTQKIAGRFTWADALVNILGGSDANGQSGGIPGGSKEIKEGSTEGQLVYLVLDQVLDYLSGKAATRISSGGGKAAELLTELEHPPTANHLQGNKIPNSELKAPPPKRGNAPIGQDGHPVELHHRGQQPDSPLDELTRTDHRGKGNFGKNHTNTGQEPSKIDRKKWKNEQREYWNKEWDDGRWDD